MVSPPVDVESMSPALMTELAPVLMMRAVVASLSISPPASLMSAIAPSPSWPAPKILSLKLVKVAETVAPLTIERLERPRKPPPVRVRSGRRGCSSIR